MSIILRQLIWRILALIALTSGLLLAIPHATPLASDELQGLGLCNNPCWNGIEPGATAFDHVPDLVSAQRPDLMPGTQHFAAAPGFAIQTPTLEGSISATWTQVGYVNLNLRIPLWRLLLLLDTPNCVRTLGNPQHATLLEVIWENDEMALISNFFLDQANDDPVSHSLTLWLATYSLCGTLDSAQHWPGFAALQRRARQG